MIARIEEQIQRETNIKAGFEKLLQATQVPGEANLKNKRDIQLQLVATQQKILELQKQMLAIQRQQGETSANNTESSHAKSLVNKVSVIGDRDRDASPATPELQRKLKTMFNGKEIHNATEKPDQSEGGNMDASVSSTEESIQLVKDQVQSTLDKACSSFEPLPSRKVCAEQILYLLQVKDINLKLILNVDSLMRSVRYLLVDPFKDMRLLALRIVKYFLNSAARVKAAFQQHHLDVLLCRILTRESKLHVEERDYTVRVVRACLDVVDGAQYLPQSVVRVLVAIAEQPDDRLRCIAIETLCELSVRHAKTAVFCDVPKVLVGAIAEGPASMALICIPSLLFLVDHQDTRRYLRPQVELEALAAVITNSQTKAETRVDCCAQALLAVLQHWSGLFYLCSDGTQMLKTLVDSLRYSSEESKKVLLKFFFALFKIELPNWFADFVSARGKNVHLYPTLEEEVVLVQETSKPLPPLQYDRLVLVDCYKALLAHIFIQQGLLDALIAIVQDEASYSKQLTTRATILIGEILEISNQLLPRAQTQSAYLLPSLFEIASNFVDETRRHNATGTFTNIESMIKAKEKLLPGAQVFQRAGLIQKQVDKIKQTMGLQMDDKTFQQLLDTSQVSVTKDFTLWNWDIIAEVVQGPLASSKRLEEALNPRTKFIKRLIGFYKPSHLQFSTMSRSRPATSYVKIGINLLEQLTAHNEGYAYLADNELFPQIVQGLLDLERAIVDPQYDKSTCLFHPGRINATLSGYYFHFLGVLSKSSLCSNHLLGHTFHLFDVLHRLVGRISDEISSSLIALDAIQASLAHLDYSRDEQPRALLARSLTCNSVALRLFATRHLRQVMRTRPDDFANWGIPLLVTQLFDPDDGVVRLAVDVCDEACNVPENLRELVLLKPKLEGMGEACTSVLLRCLSETEGFISLLDSGFVAREHDYWIEIGCFQYVAYLELMLDANLSTSKSVNSQGLFESKSDGTSKPSNMRQSRGTGKAAMSMDEDGKPGGGSEVKGSAAVSGVGVGLNTLNHYAAPCVNWELERMNMVPVHFFGELCQTKAGASWLESRGTVDDLVAFLSYYLTVLSTENREKRSTILQCKSVLWAIGHIGCSRFGIPLLMKRNALELVDSLARKSTTFSVRGTCLYVICLLSKTAMAAEKLSLLGYDAVITTQDRSIAICLPKNSEEWLKVPSWTFQGSWPKKQASLLIKHKNLDEMEAQILQGIGGLGNHIVASAASRNLSKWRSEYPAYFCSFPLYLEVHRLTNLYHYKLNARRYILDLFERVSFNKDQLDMLDGSKYYQFGKYTNAVHSDKVLSDLLRQTNTWNAVFAPPPNEAKGKPPKDGDSADSSCENSSAEEASDLSNSSSSSSKSSVKGKATQSLQPKKVTVGFPILA